jgi:hypothetical protein
MTFSFNFSLSSIVLSFNSIVFSFNFPFNSIDFSNSIVIVINDNNYIC